MEAGTVDGGDYLRVLTSGGPVPLGFDRRGDQIFLVARERSARWPVELLRGGEAVLLLPGGRTRGVPQLVSDPAERAEILAGFRTKYGPSKFERWYDHPSRVLKVRLSPEAPPAGPGSNRYYEWIESEFDNVADDYDRHILGNRMNRLLRERSLAWLGPRLDGCARLLEVGCGSGTETIPMLERGHSLVAVDISGRMLRAVEAKAAARGLSDRLATRRLRARDLELLTAEFGPGSFAGGYSTYGALNCEPELGPFAAALSRLLPPGAPFVAGVYNRWCLFELVGYAATLRPRRAFGRRKNPVPVGASRFCVDVYAYSPADVAAAFEPWFRTERIEGVPVLLPPSDLAPYAERFARHFGRLASLDAWAGRRWPLSRLGDHFLLTFVRRGGGTS